MLYLFDVDGTLIRSFLRDTPAESAEVYDRVELLPGRAGLLHALAKDGNRFGIVTNQDGVAFGYQTKEQVGVKIARVLKECAFFYGQPFSVHICFHHPRATIDEYRDPEGCKRRKPERGMILEAMAAHYGPSESAGGLMYRAAGKTVFVGDMATDAEAAKAAGVTYHDAEAFFA